MTKATTTKATTTKAMLRQASVFLAACFLLTSCVSTEVVTANSKPAIQASEPLPPEQLLDLGILPLDPNIPDDPKVLEKEIIEPDVRRAESRFIAYHLKNTLELTGNWGAVRVIPDSSDAVDLEITGTILASHGEHLKVQLQAKDATGRVWLKKTYSDIASKFSYESATEDPFQDLYNDMANDLLKAREKLSAESVANIKQVAALKFAQDLSPKAFDGYLKKKWSGKIAVKQLPADNDSMMARVDRIKEQEYLFVDVLDDYYSRFYREVEASYSEWRHATYDEVLRRREAKRQARRQLIGGIIGVAGGIIAGSNTNSRAGVTAADVAVGAGIYSIYQSVGRFKEAKIHAETLKELGQSLSSEVSPYVLEIEGRSIELSGNVQQQYEQWRLKLRDIYAAETGLTSAQ